MRSITKSVMKNKPQLHIHLSEEHRKYQRDVANAFKGLNISFDGGLVRASEADLPMQLIVGVGAWVASNIAWDLLKAGVRRLYKKFANSRVTIRDTESVMYTIKQDFTVSILVMPSEVKKFEHIKTIDDLAEHLKKVLQRNTIDNWKIVPASDIFIFIKSYTFSRENLVDQASNIHGIGSIHYGDIHSTFSSPSINLDNILIPTIKDEGFSPEKKNLLQDGDLIMADASEDYEGIGVSVSIHGVGNKKVVGGLHTFVLRDNKNQTLEHFRKYIFRNPKIRNTLQKVANGVSVYGISKKEISKLLLPIPPLPEQNRIVAVLETWDRTIEKLTKKIEIKKQIKKGLMQKLLTGKKRLPGFKNDWGFVELGEVCKRITKRNEENNQNILTISAQDGLVSQDSYYYKRIAADSLINYRLLSKGDFAYNKSYSKGYPMGAIKRLNKYEEGIVSSLYIVFSAHAINSAYLEHYFNIGLYNKEIALVAQEGARNHGLLNIGVEDFFSGDLYIPKSRKEQDAIAKVLTAADKEIEQLTKKLALLEDQKKYLLNNLIAGVMRTPENLKINY